MTKQFVLQSCFCYVLLRHANIMTDKGFNIFIECAARCVHLFPEEEECTSSFWEGSKMFTSGKIPHSQRTLAEINKSGAIDEGRI